MRIWMLWCVVGWAAASGWAQEAAGPTLEGVRARLEQLADDPALAGDGAGEAARLAAVTEALEQATVALEQTAADEAEAARWRSVLADGPGEADAVEALDPPARLTTEAAGAEAEASSMTAEAAAQRLRDAESDRARLVAELQAAEARLVALRNRPEVLRGMIDEATAAVAEPGEPVAAGTDAVVAEALETLAAARRRRAAARLDALTQERAALDVQARLATAQRNRLVLERDAAAAAVEAWTPVVAGLKQQEAARQQAEAQAARRAVEDLPEAVRGLADEVLELGAMQEAVTARHAAVQTRLGELTEQAARLDASLTAAEQRVETLGMTTTVGATLQQQRRRLPSRVDLVRRGQAADRELRDALATQMDLEDRLRGLDERVAAVRRSVSGGEDDAAARTEAVVRQYQRLLAEANASYAALIADHTALDTTRGRLLATVDRYQRFLDERLLWMPNLQPVSGRDVSDAAALVGEAASPAAWGGLLRGLRQRLGSASALAWVLVLLPLLGFAATRWLRAKRASANAGVGRLKEDGIGKTAKAAWYGGLLAARGPGLLLALGAPLTGSGVESDAARSLGAGLVAAGVFVAPLAVLHAVARPGGLGPVHFGWSETTVRRLGAFASGAAWGVGPLVLLHAAAGAWPGGDAAAAAARLVLIAGALTLAGVIGWAYRPRAGASFRAAADPASPAKRGALRWGYLARFAGAVAVPVALACLAAAGYAYTAERLGARLHLTFTLVAGLVLLKAFALRWLTLTQRQLHYQRLLKKREAWREARAKEQALREAGDGADDGDGGEGTEDAIEAQIAKEDDELAAEQIDEQTQGLVRSSFLFALVIGLYAAWAAVLPALGLLNDVTLWTQSVTVDGEPQSVPITMANVIFAALVGLLTYTAARHLPGLLDVLVVARLKPQAGTRYAAKLLTQYLIVIVGVSVTLSVLGFGWSRIQWLVAALSVGLGFGLQEIVANFVSGVIILFERPVRVGDTVTVAGNTGIVTRIRIRATTITDFDLRELIIPNKNIITGELVNWSLSNAVTRVIVPVGVAYGSDTELTRRLLLRAASEDDEVLESPAPSALFNGFGDNTLNFELRIFVSDVMRRFIVSSHMHYAIDRLFREHGIEIAFPQRDVHLDVSAPVPVRLEPGDTGNP